MMKTIVLFNSYDYGSTGTLCTSLKNYLKERGIKTFFIVGNKKKSGSGDFYLTDSTCKLFRFLLIKKNAIFGNSTLDLSKHITNKVIRFLKSKIDFQKEEVIFHFHNMQYSFMSTKRLIKFAENNNVKTVLTMHDCWPITGGCNYFTKNNCDKWEKANQNCKKCNYSHRNAKRELLLKEKMFRNTCIISPSNWLDNLVDKSILNKCNHIVINNGIDTSFWNYNLADKQSNTINLISVASPWDERKGLSYLNKIAEIMPENFKLTVVGLQDDQPTNCRINRFGKIEREQLKELYSKSHFFVNPSLEDNFPTVNIEALLCGLFVCSFDTGGSKEIFDNETGYVTKEKEASELLDAIIKTKISETLFSKCRQRGLSFGMDEYCNKHFNLYNKI